jgi:hypothetical protein
MRLYLVPAKCEVVLALGGDDSRHTEEHMRKSPTPPKECTSSCAVVAPAPIYARTLPLSLSASPQALLRFQQQDHRWIRLIEVNTTAPVLISFSHSIPTIRSTSNNLPHLYIRTAAPPCSLLLTCFACLLVGVCVTCLCDTDCRLAGGIARRHRTCSPIADGNNVNNRMRTDMHLPLLQPHQPPLQSPPPIHLFVSPLVTTPLLVLDKQQHAF